LAGDTSVGAVVGQLVDAVVKVNLGDSVFGQLSNVATTHQVTVPDGIDVVMNVVASVVEPMREMLPFAAPKIL